MEEKGNGNESPNRERSLDESVVKPRVNTDWKNFHHPILFEEPPYYAGKVLFAVSTDRHDRSQVVNGHQESVKRSYSLSAQPANSCPH